MRTDATLAAGSAGEVLVYAMMLGGIVLLAWGIRQWLATARATRPGRPEPRERPGEGRAVDHDRASADWDELRREIEALSVRVGEQAEQRAMELQGLIAQADDRLARLRALDLPTPREPGLSERVPVAPRAEVVVREPVRVEPKAPARPAMDEGLEPLHREVVALAQQGLTPVEIAQRVHRPTGQVELILALSRAGGA